MRLINIKTYKLEEFLEKPPAYAILSHTWGHENEELTLRDVEEGRIHKPGVGSAKFLGACQQATKDGLGYVWIDTCCIDKTNLVELSEAINSMFRWYECASICYAYLSDVPAGDAPENPDSKLRSSRWFRRGWTLQELLAPKRLEFYDAEWNSLGQKTSRLRNVIRDITGIPTKILRGITAIHATSIAQRMSWAARRETKRKEDTAYCLLGIFGVSMSMIYGEGAERAFFRLQEQIMKTTRDDSILAWGLPGSDKIPVILDRSDRAPAGRILAISPSDFAHSGHIVRREREGWGTQLDPLEISGGMLRLSLPLLSTPAGLVLGLLSCGPEDDPQRVVGIPLTQAASGALHEYVRPEGYHAELQPTTAAGVSYTTIHIRNDLPRTESRDMWQKYVLDDAFEEVNLRLIDVYPSSCGDKDSAMILVPSTPFNDSNTSQILARFRHPEQDTPDFVILLEVTQRDSAVEPSCHVMVCSRNTQLQELADKLEDVAKKVSGRNSASNGLLHIRVSVEPDTQQSMFTIKPEILSHPPHGTVNISTHLDMWGSVLQLVEAWEAEKQSMMEREALQNEVEDKASRLQGIKQEQETIEELIKTLETRKRELAEEEINVIHEMDLLMARRTSVEEGRKKVSERWRLARKRWDELGRHDGGNDGLDVREVSEWNPIYWASERGYTEIVELLLLTRDLTVTNEHGWTPLIVASKNGHSDVVRILIDKGADITAKDTSDRTALWYALEAKHEAIVQLLLGGPTVTSCKRNATSRKRGVLNVDHFKGLPTALAISPNSELLSLGLYHGQVQLWDIEPSGFEEVILSMNEISLEDTDNLLRQPVIFVTFAPNSAVLAAGCRNGTIWIWDTTTGRLVQSFTDFYFALTFAPSSMVLAWASYDNTVRLWNAETGLEQSLWHPDRVSSLAFAPNSTMLASGSEVGVPAIKLWDATTGKLLRTLKDDRYTAGNIRFLAFAPNSTKLASGYGYNNGIVRIWNIVTGQLQQTFKHTEKIRSMAFAPSSTILALADGKTVLLWDILSGNILHALEIHAGDSFASVVFAPRTRVNNTPNSSMLIATTNNSFNIWDIIVE